MATQTWTATADFASPNVETTRLNDAIQTRHQGNADGVGFSAANMPDASGETLSGWTMTLAGGSTSSVSFSGGKTQFTTKSELSTAKTIKYERPTNASIAKGSTFTYKIGRIRFSAMGEFALLGLFNSASEQTVNSIRIRFRLTLTAIQTYDSTGTLVQNNTGAAIATSTDYWVTVRGDGTNITLDVYTTEALWIADGNGDHVNKSVSVASIGGTITCNTFGVRNLADAANDKTDTFTVEQFDGSACNWYDDSQANCVDKNFDHPCRIDYSSFAVSTTGTGTAKFDLRKKESSGGSYTAYTNGGAHYTVAEIQALEDENLHGLGLVAYGDVTPGTYFSIDDVAADCEADWTAPALLGELDLAVLTGKPEIDDAILIWKQGVDEEGGSGFRCHVLRREDAGGSNVEHLVKKTDDNGVLYEWSDDEFDIDAAYKFFNADKGAASLGEFDNASRAFLVDGHEPGKVYKIGGIDAAGNRSWTTFPAFTPAGTDTGGGYNFMECLRIIANKT